MNGELVIPRITDPMGSSWRQPHRRYIEIDNTHALMSEQTFKGLVEYSTSLPSGVYSGKMWRACKGGIWFLAWYYPSNDTKYMNIEWREIIIV